MSIIKNGDDFYSNINHKIKDDSKVDIATFNMTVASYNNDYLVSFLDMLKNNENHRILIGVPKLRECKPNCKDCKMKYNENIKKLNMYSKIWNIRFLKDSHLKYFKIDNEIYTGGVNLGPSQWHDTMIRINNKKVIEDYDEFFEELWNKAEHHVNPIDLDKGEPMTEKQEKFVRAIEDRLDVEFKGKTKQEASDFISDHIDEYYKNYNEEFGPTWAESNGYN